MTSKTHTFLIKISLGLAAVGFVMALYLFWAWNVPRHPGNDVYTVKPGTSLRSFARDLTSRGVLSESFSFVWLAHLTGRARSLKSGEYQFRDGITAGQLLDQVMSGRVIKYPVVLLEGWTFQQYVKTLAAAPRLTHQLAGLSEATIMERLGHSGEHPEGRFFPDTYYYSAGQTDHMILVSAYDKMQKLLDREWATREADLPFKTKYEALILSSIVEKETGRQDERQLIAGVFVNRLRLGMRLQTDPTVIYGLGKSFDGNLRLKDLRRDGPYNTYTRRGLPPTPIAMPGLLSLQAVLHPTHTKALYFVSRNDGSHVFSETLEEHTNAVIKFQLKGKSRRAAKLDSENAAEQNVQTGSGR